MKDVAQYPVTFPYGATTAPYSPTHPHLGEDRKCPIGTPDVVNGQVIALSGNSGTSTGPHHHVQRVSKGKVIAPLGGGFSLPKPVTVIEIGERSDIGKFVRLKDGNNEIWSRFHLSKILVKVGDQIGGQMTTQEATAILDSYYWSHTGRKVKQSELDEYIPVFVAGTPDKFFKKAAQFPEVKAFLGTVKPDPDGETWRAAEPHLKKLLDLPM